MRTPVRVLMITTAVLLGAVQTGSAASSHRVTHPARAARAAPAFAQGNWCLQYHTGGTNCAFGDFQGCMYAAAAYGGNCGLSPSWRARYGDSLPPLDLWQYGGIADRCFSQFDLRCY
jgi:hypothetical protein